MRVIEKVEEMRKLMKESKIDAYIIPSSDSHQSEYVSDHWKSRRWMSGFTGSAGTLVITLGENGLWTDGRYYIQAEKQLKDSGIKLFRQGQPGVPTYNEWLEQVLKEGSCVGFDGKVFSQANAKKIEEALSDKGITINDSYDLMNIIWTDRPELPFNNIINHDISFAGKSIKEKVELVREKMKEKKADNYILGSLDDIAWLFNIRGSDIPNNPVVTAYAIITHEKVSLFLRKEKLSKSAQNSLLSEGVYIYEYEEIIDEVKKITEDNSVFIDDNKINRWLYNVIPKGCKIVKGTNITTSLKAIKNDTEIENLKRCQIKDGVAMVKFLYWLEENINRETITEISADEKLRSFRSAEKDFIGISFDTIAGYKDHAAMMHYKANDDTKYTLKDEGMFLIDSGGQYLDGTTDITRTIVLGDITEEEKRDFTLVLKGHISLCQANFLHGATGSNLDILARYPMWQEGIDYKCGTGHGVGYFLNVHEGPQNFSQVPNKVKLEKNMVITVEPGIYREGQHGVRIENTVAVAEDVKTEFGQFLRFDTISYCPIDLKGISVEMLDEKEKRWLNEYHNEVYNKLAPYLDDDTSDWLRTNTQGI